ncbi:hypothetical protein BG011_004148 [Mortierella polycephala]|uniref:Uncharacterized protein n=1 Tax=Mortierella polycephala TaxID=41804 RepID=A0A9P6U216_9FUNG|nr:hypothetical protein BG011_004148 [Mortierella polycephala]
MGHNSVQPDEATSQGSMQVATTTAIAIITKTSPASTNTIYTTPSTSRHHHKKPSLSIQTTSFSKNTSSNWNSSSDGNNNRLSPETVGASSPESSSATPSSSSPMSHIRRWTSNLSASSKNNQEATKSPRRHPKGLPKVRTIGPIGSPQPLTTPVPYACTPLPYADSPTSIPSPYSASMATTSCPNLSTGPQYSDFSISQRSLNSHSNLPRGQRTSWKNRIFSSSTKRQGRRASTNSSVDDDIEWANLENDYWDAVSTTRLDKCKIRISAPLTRPILPPNRKTIDIIPSPLLSPNGVYGFDTDDHWQAGSKDTRSTSDIDRSILDILKHATTGNTGHIHVFNQSQQRDRFSKSFTAFMEHEHSTPAKETTERENQERNAAEFCRGGDSTFMMPPSLPVRSSMTSEATQIHPLSNDEESPRGRTPLRVRIGAKNRASRSPSICSISSESSVSSMDSTSSSESDSSQTSPISGASFFSSPPNAATIAKASSLPTALLKSDGIEIPMPPLSTPPITPPLDHIDPAFKSTMALAQLNIAMTATPMDPRALAIKRQAHIHTLKKIRERERRPFLHAVLLHSFLLQLRRGVTNKHCNEVGDFYSAMSASQSTPRLDFTNAMTIAYQQQYGDQMSNDGQRLETQQNNKESKPKRSLVSSIQNRLLANKTQSGNSKSSSNNNSASASDSVSPSPSSSTFYLPGLLNAPSSTLTQSSAQKERLPLLRIPTYNNSRRVDENENEMTRPTPTAIIPKRTTGRKGLIYQQQQQLQLRLQFQNASVSGPFMYPPHAPAQPGDRTRPGFDQDQEWLHAQIMGTLGIRPSFETSTYTTIRVEPSDVITKPLVSPSAVPHLSPLHRPSPYTLPGLVKSSDTSSFKAMSPAPYQIHSHHHPMNHPSPSMSSPVPYVQNPPRPDRCLGDQANHIGSMKSNRTTLEFPKQKQLVDGKSMNGAIIAPSGLPSPPLSPTLESKEVSAVTTRFNNNTATTSPANVETAAFIAATVPPSQGGRWAHPTQLNGYWNNEAALDVLAHHGIEDIRIKNRKQQQMQMMRMRRINSIGTGIRGEYAREELEEDLPLALVQRRISADTLRLSA